MSVEVTADQGSAEWFSARLGCATASRFGEIFTPSGRPSTGVGRRGYALQLLQERLTGQVAPQFQSAATMHGTQYEPEALAAAELELGTSIRPSGFWRHAEMHAGASPDGFLESAGVEVKCPFSSGKHLEALLTGEVPSEHLPQIYGGLWVTGAPRWLFVSYDPRLPQHLRLFAKWVERDEEYIAGLQLAIEQFLGEVQQLEERCSAWRLSLRSEPKPARTKKARASTARSEESLKQSEAG